MIASASALPEHVVYDLVDSSVLAVPRVPDRMDGQADVTLGVPTVRRISSFGCKCSGYGLAIPNVILARNIEKGTVVAGAQRWRVAIGSCFRWSKLRLRNEVRSSSLLVGASYFLLIQKSFANRTLGNLFESSLRIRPQGA